MKRWIVVALLAMGASGARAAPLGLIQNFDDLATSGWIAVNASVPIGTTSWFQGNPSIFGSFSGAPTAYAAANYLSTGPLGGTISTWLFSPEIDFAGQTLSFYTRTEPGLGTLFGDGLRVLTSANGASLAFGDFSPILAINPTNVGGGYPEDWTRFFAMLGTFGTGRIAFQYTVNANASANYIGIDSVTVIPEPSVLALLGVAVTLAGVAVNRRRGKLENAT